MQGKNVLVVMAAATVLLGACKRETKDERFRRECEQYTQKDCPREMMEGIVLDSLSYDIGSRTRSEFYTLSGTLDNDSLLTDDVRNDLRESLLKDVKNSLQLKAYKDEGISMRYVYISQASGKVLIELTLKQEDYK